MKKNVILASLVLILLPGACGRTNSPKTSAQPAPAPTSAALTAPRPPFEIIATYPHDPNAFTQGLAFADGYLYEGTGRYKQSTLRRVRLDTGEVVHQRALDGNLFGEGITLWKDKIIQLTWQNGIGFVYDRSTFEPLGQFNYSGEGWGITADNDSLWMSDGSDVLRKLDPETLKQVSTLPVRDNGRPVKRLNELEFIRGEIWANVWLTNTIVRINPTNGVVSGRLELNDLWPQHLRPSDEAVLNGIAYDPKADRLFVTGKLWPKLYEIKVSQN